MKTIIEYINESKEMTRSDMIKKLKSFMNGKKTIEIPEDFWINDGVDGEGEDLEVYTMGTQTKGYGKGQFGVWAGPDDEFFTMDDLSEDELDNLIDYLNDYL